MKAIAPKSVAASSLPDDKKLQCFDLHTGLVFWVSKTMYNRLSSEKKGAFNQLNPFHKRYYNLSEFSGQKIDIYHLQSGKLEFMTLELFQEIQRRNPAINIPTYENNVKVSDDFVPWKKYLTTVQEAKAIKGAAKERSIEDIIEEKVNEKLSKSIQATEKLDQVTDDKPKQGRRGRKPKEIKQ